LGIAGITMLSAADFVNSINTDSTYRTLPQGPLNVRSNVLSWLLSILFGQQLRGENVYFALLVVRVAVWHSVRGIVTMNFDEWQLTF
jgi:hypothetical protein